MLSSGLPSRFGLLQHTCPVRTYYEVVRSFFRQLFSLPLWTAIRRFHKDRRARALLWQVLLPLLFLVGFTIYVVINKGLAVIAIGIDVVLFALIFWYRKRNPIERSGPLTLDLAPRPDIAPLPAVQATPELLRECAERMLLQAILAHRAASEAFLKHNGLPEGKQIVTRQNHLKLLRGHGMLDRLGSVEKDLVLAPDGAWDEDTIDRASLLLEPVRVFRWLLRLDPRLPLVGEAALVDFRLAGSLLEDPERAFGVTAMVDMEDIRTTRTAAEQIFYRCYSEGQKRGLYIDASAENAEKAIFYAERLAGREDEDVLIGHIIVSRASDDEVRLAAQVALSRIRLLQWVQGRLYGDIAAIPELRAFTGE